MAVHKLLNRIVTPEEVDYGRKNTKKIAADLHDYTLYVTNRRHWYMVHLHLNVVVVTILKCQSLTDI